jgi:hypothetical protein
MRHFSRFSTFLFCTKRNLYYICSPKTGKKPLRDAERRQKGSLPRRVGVVQKRRELSSAGSEHLPYKQRVGGSNPSAPTKKTIRDDGFFVSKSFLMTIERYSLHSILFQPPAIPLQFFQSAFPKAAFFPAHTEKVMCSSFQCDLQNGAR